MSDGAHALLLVAMLVLPLSALIARRVPLNQTVKMAAIWVLLFATVAVVVTQLDRLRGGGGSSESTSGTTERISRDPDGHYWVNARINGIERRMLVDSGATTTALSIATAKAAAIDTEESTFPRMIDTANGPVLARTAHVSRLGIGSIKTRDLPVVVSEAFAEQDVIGMNFLSRLKSWRVEGDDLILTPPDPQT